MPLLEEEDPANDEQLIKHLTEEEKKARDDAKAAKAEEAKKGEEEKAAKEAEEVGAMDDLGKI